MSEIPTPMLAANRARILAALEGLRLTHDEERLVEWLADWGPTSERVAALLWRVREQL